MERFVLWNISSVKDSKTLSFFAMQVQTLRINQGTKEMIAEMLSDLGAPNVAFDSWSLRYFLTDYLGDEPRSADWKDMWAPTWEITVQLAHSINLAVEEDEDEDGGLIRSYARDRTWKEIVPITPAPCVIVADMCSQTRFSTAKEVLNQLNLLMKEPRLVQTLSSQAQDVDEKLFDQLRSAYTSLTKSSSGHPVFSVEEYPGLPLRLVVWLGTFDEAFYSNGAELARIVKEIIAGLQGYTTWHEKHEPVD